MSSCHRCMPKTDLPPEYPEQANEQSIYQTAIFARIRKNRRKAAVKLAMVAVCEACAIAIMKTVIIIAFPVLWLIGRWAHEKNVKEA